MTISPVAFPIIEQVLPAALRTALAARPEPYAKNVLVGKEIPTDASGNPAPRPRMVTIAPNGGPVRDWTGYPRLLINVYGSTDAEADNLARLVVALLPTLVGPQIDAVRVLSGPVDVTDKSEHPKRYITAEAATRAANL